MVRDDEMHMKTLWIKDEYLQLILAGCKTIEVRVGYSNIEKLHAIYPPEKEALGVAALEIEPE